MPTVRPSPRERQFVSASTDGPPGAAPTGSHRSTPERRPGRGPRQFWSQIFRSHPLVTFSFVLGVMFAILFGTDLCTGWLFGRASMLMDVGFTICSLGLLLLCWESCRDLR